jgi:hypothetical protein
VVLGFGAGIGFGSMAEFLDQSVRRAEDLEKVAGYPVLAVIPHLETVQDRARKAWRRMALVGSTVGIVVVGLAALHFFFRPLDVLWVQIVRKLYISF